MHNQETHNFQYVFGPVASRRLGLSLGVDLVPAKTCTLDCVYCEAGRTNSLTCERREWVPLRDVLSELESFLAEKPLLDSITFSGSGEPTLHSGIGVLIDEIHARWPGYPVTVLTNGTLFFMETVRADLVHADRVIASYDASGREAFRRLNRPCEGLSPESMLEGFRAFRKMYPGEFLIEVFVVPGINDTDDEMEALARDLSSLGADGIQLNTLDRPGVENWVRTADAALLDRFRVCLGQAELASSVREEAVQGETAETALREKILDMVKRRPLTLDDVLRTRAVGREQAEQVLQGLVQEGILCRKQMPRGNFFVLSSASYDDKYRKL